MKKNLMSNEQGMILVMVMLLMMVIAVMGTMAINSSTIDIQIFGNQKRGSEALSVAEAGVDVSIPIIENTVADGQVPDFTALPAIVANADLGDEILGTVVSVDAVNNGPDVTLTMPAGGAVAKADIDRLYAEAVAGGSMEFAGGYEGVGASAAGGGIAILYRVRSEGFR